MHQVEPERETWCISGTLPQPTQAQRTRLRLRLEFERLDEAVHE